MKKDVFNFPDGEWGISTFQDDRGNIWLLSNKAVYVSGGAYGKFEQQKLVINLPDDPLVSVKAEPFNPQLDDEIPF